ncbi:MULTISPECIES: potassium-transporting ATPase subunit C [Ruminococcus]|nr:potassium-transporting ATPase subunit C [Ruminococcus hominis]
MAKQDRTADVKPSGIFTTIEKCTDSRFLGVFGEKTVNVLKVNLMLDGIL